MRFLKKYYLLIIFTLLGIGLRLYHNTDISLWHDEAFSALLIRYPWHEMMYRIGLDVHPPMYYIFLRLWHYVFGESLWSLRGFSVFFGAGLIPLSYAFVKTAFKNERAALWAAVFIALNPFQIQYVTEARMYTMGAFFALLAAYFLLKALAAEETYYADEKLNMPNLPQDRKLRRSLLLNYLGFALSTSIIMYTHYYLLFTTIALGAYGLFHHFRHYGGVWKRYGYLLGSFVLIGVLYLPWLKTFLFQFSQVSAAYWIPLMDRWSIPTTVFEMFAGTGVDITRATHQAVVIGVTLFSLYFLYRLVKKTGQNGWLVTFNVLAPFAGALAFALLSKLRGGNSSVFLVRYFLFASTFYSIALAVWLESIRPKWWGYALVTAYIVANILSFGHYWKDLDITHKPGMAGAAKFLSANVEPQHKLIVGTSFEFFNYKYYRAVYDPTPVAPVLYTGGSTRVDDLPHFAGTAILTDADLFPDFKTVPSGDTVWLIWTNGFGSDKPITPDNWVQVDEKGFADVRPFVGTWVVVTEYKVN